MRKDLALAVLWAVVSLLGPLNVDGNPYDDDDGDDDAGVECLEFRHGKGEPRVLDAASQACGEPIESAYVARDSHHAHGPSAAAAVQQPASHLAVVNLTVYADADEQAKIAGPALAGALDHCRDQGVLKVVIQSQGIAPPLVRLLAEARGFQYSRVHPTTEPLALEFFTDLYWHRGDKHA